MRSPCSTHTPVDSLRMGYPHSQGGMHTTLLRSVPYTLRSVHMGTARRGSAFPEEAVPLKGTKSSRGRSEKQTAKRNDTLQEHEIR
jgi:hypothetical protein